MKINGFMVQSFHLSEAGTRELFEIVRKKGLFLSADISNRVKKMTVPFGGYTFLCRHWRPNPKYGTRGYVTFDREGIISITTIPRK